MCVYSLPLPIPLLLSHLLVIVTYICIYYICTTYINRSANIYI